MAARIGELYKQDNWKTEKHVPVLECPDTVQKGQAFEARVSVGKEVAHPNTTEHHIRWIKLYFLPDGAGAAFEVARIEFSAHGESTQGADQGPVHAHHQGSAFLKLTKSGTLYATSYCNIHGLWEDAKAIRVG